MPMQISLSARRSPQPAHVATHANGQCKSLQFVAKQHANTDHSGIRDTLVWTVLWKQVSDLPAAGSRCQKPGFMQPGNDKSVRGQVGLQ